MKYLLLIILTFQLQTATAQLLDLPQNHSFSTVTRDSILSKLLQRETLVKQYRIAQLVIKAQDKQIIQIAEESRLKGVKNDYLETAIETQEEINIFDKELTKSKAKKRRKTLLIAIPAAIITGYAAGKMF